MQFQALTSGYAFPTGPFEAQVHSVFHHAVNLRLRNGDLITLVTPDGDDLPQGARLAGSEVLGFDEMGLSRSLKAACRGGVVRFERSDLKVDLRAARAWRGNLAVLAADPDRQSVRRTLKLVTGQLILYASDHPGGLNPQVLFSAYPPAEGGGTQDNRLTQKAYPPIRELIHAARQLVSPPNQAVEKLVGLGTGLTPSGDDFLVGLLAGLWSCTGMNAARHVFTTRLGETVRAVAGMQTNEISRAYLLHASHAQAARRLYELASAICLPAPADRLCQLTQAALAIGHTSGIDTVCGLLAGFSAWSAEDALPS